MDEHVIGVASERGLNIEALLKADEEGNREITDFRQSLQDALAPETHRGIDVVLCGSFARREITVESDCDYLVLVNELDDHQAVTRVVSEVERLRDEKNFAPHGQQGIFGDFVTSTELVARIGLEADSNIGMTRRLLLLRTL